MDHVHLRHSNRFPTLCTLTVDGFPQGSPVSPSSPPSASGYEWHLPSGDPRDEGKFLFRLHTLDIYFWTLDDANLFLDSVEHVLSPGQIETDRHHHPSQAHEDAMSTVVQQLENAAITDPAYQNGHSRPESVSLPPAQPAAGTGPVPSSRTSVQYEQTNTATYTHPQGQVQEEPVNYTPLPYNPAAPAAPEPIKHREKTPPPVDGAEGTGLAAAAAADERHPYAHPSPPLSGGFTTPPATTQGLSYSTPGVAAQPGYMSPPPSAGLPPPSAGLPPNAGAGLTHTHTASVSSHSSLQNTPRTPSFPGPPVVATTPSPFPQPQPGTTTTMSFAPPPTQDTNAYLYDQHHQQQHQQQVYASYQQPQQQQQYPQQQQQQYYNHQYQPQPQPQPQYVADYTQHQNIQTQAIQNGIGVPQPPQQSPIPVPIGGFSTYSYDQPSQHQHTPSGTGSEYDIHSQVYRPTEAEAKSHYYKEAQKAMKKNKTNKDKDGQVVVEVQRPRKLEEGAARVEKGVNRLLRKLEKHL